MTKLVAFGAGLICPTSVSVVTSFVTFSTSHNHSGFLFSINVVVFGGVSLTVLVTRGTTVLVGLLTHTREFSVFVVSELVVGSRVVS